MSTCCKPRCQFCRNVCFNFCPTLMSTCCKPCCPFFQSVCFSKILSFALLDLEFSKSSCSLGSIGFLVTTLPLDFLPQVQIGNSGGQTHGFSAVRNLFFTILSSKEWKVMMQSLPSSSRASIILSMESSSTSSSLFSSIRIAWKVLFAGCPEVALILAGMAPEMISDSSNVVSMRFFSRY